MAKSKAPLITDMAINRSCHSSVPFSFQLTLAAVLFPYPFTFLVLHVPLLLAIVQPLLQALLESMLYIVGLQVLTTFTLTIFFGLTSPCFVLYTVAAFAFLVGCPPLCGSRPTRYAQITWRHGLAYVNQPPQQPSSTGSLAFQATPCF